jgi:hypothetical protein
MNLCARTRLMHIHSDEGEDSVVYPPVRALEDALHEAHIRIHKRERQDLIGGCVGARLVTADIPLADEPVEVGDRRGFGPVPIAAALAARVN